MARRRKALEDVCLPLSGKWHLCQKPLSDHILVFVHPFGGDRKSCEEHAELANTLGFDAVTFDLSFQQLPTHFQIPWDSRMNLGLMNVWVEEIEAILNVVPGHKILYGFGITAGALPLTAIRRNCTDLSAMIFDSGPVLNTWQMALPTLLSPSRSLPARLFTTLGHRLIFGANFPERSRSALERLPRDFPILSIRSWKDDVVPSTAIERYFEPAQQTDLEVLNLTDSPHLEGIKRNADEYSARVRQFFKGTWYLWR